MNSVYSTSHTSSGAAVLVATGRLHFGAAGVLRRQLRDLIDAGATRVVVDLSGVTTIDSSGVGALIFGLKSARSAGGDLILVGPNESIEAILAMMNLTKVLVTCESIADAFPGSRRHE